MSKNEEDKIKAINDFYKKEVEILNGFLGDRGVEKLLNGRKVGWTTLEEIDDKFIETLKALVLNPEAIKEQQDDIKIVYTPLHVTGNIPVQRILK